MARVERRREAPLPVAPLVVGDVEDCFRWRAAPFQSCQQGRREAFPIHAVAAQYDVERFGVEPALCVPTARDGWKAPAQVLGDDAFYLMISEERMTHA